MKTIKIKLFIALALLACLLTLMFFVFIRNTSKEEQKIPYVPIPTLVPLSFPTTLPTTLTPSQIPPIKDTLIALMPVIVPEFTIEYHPSSGTFTVSIRKSTYEESLTKAEQWLLEHGVGKDNY